MQKKSNSFEETCAIDLQCRNPNNSCVKKIRNIGNDCINSEVKVCSREILEIQNYWREVTERLKR